MKKNEIKMKDVPHFQSVSHQCRIAIAIVLFLIAGTAHSQSLSLFDVDASNFPTIKAKFAAIDQMAEPPINTVLLPGSGCYEGDSLTCKSDLPPLNKKGCNVSFKAKHNFSSKFEFDTLTYSVSFRKSDSLVHLFADGFTYSLEQNGKGIRLCALDKDALYQKIMVDSAGAILVKKNRDTSNYSNITLDSYTNYKGTTYSINFAYPYTQDTLIVTPFNELAVIGKQDPPEIDISTLMDINPTLKVFFSQPMDTSKTLNAITLSGKNQNHVPFSAWFANDTVVFIKPKDSLDYATWYSLNFRGASNLTGDLLDSTITFRTQPAPIDTTSSVEYPISNDMLKVYPNPVDEMLKIERQGMAQATLSITNSLGQTVHKSAFGAGEQNKELPFEDAPAGAYFIRVIYPDGKVEISKFVKY